MKLASTKACMCFFCALACLLLVGICPGGASCPGPDSQADVGHAIGQKCSGHTPVSCESSLYFECAATEHLAHECRQHCSDSPFHFGCGGVLVLPNQTTSITFAAFACTGAIMNNVGLAQDGLPSQSLGPANADLPFLRTVILLT